MKEVSGKMKFGRIIARNDVSNYFFMGFGAHPWLLERRNGLARGIFNRLIEDDRFPSGQILGEVQRCLNSMLASSGFSAYQMVFGSNPADLFGWGDSDEDLLFAQGTSLAGQFANQWKLRVRAQEATLREVANGKLRRILARNQTFNCAEVAVGDMVLFYKTPQSEEIAAMEGASESFGNR